MKDGIHPDYKEITVELSDGTEFTTRSTLDPEGGVYRSEVDSKNHPFYTGKQQYSQKAGQIDRFHQRYGNTASSQEQDESEQEQEQETESQEAANDEEE